MTVYDQLCGIAELDANIEMKAIMLTELESRISEDGMSDKVKAFRQELNDDIDRLVDQKQEIMKLIGGAGLSPIELRIINLRYLCAKKWPDIAKEMHYSEASIYRLHNTALEKLNK